MSTFLLIHGGWSGGWCWYKVRRGLEAKGHRVLTPDLPGHGENERPLSEITLEAYARATVEFATAEPEKVIAVGHSMTGISNTQAAEYAPDQFKALVYLAAFLPSNGQSLLDIAADDPENLVLRNLTHSEDGLCMTFKPEAIKEAVFADCSDEDILRGAAQMRPQASAPFRAPAKLTEERSGRIPKYYIECLQDRAITIQSQRAMIAANPCEKVFTIDSSHAPFYSRPDEVVQHLLSI